MMINQYRGEFYALLNAFAWGTSIILFKLASSKDSSPFAMNLFKNLIGLILFAITIAFLGLNFYPLLDDLVYLKIIISSILGLTISDYFLMQSLKNLQASHWAIIDCFYGPAFALAGYLFLDEVLNFYDWIGVLMVISSILLFSGLERRNKNVQSNLKGAFYALIAIVTNIAAIVLLKPLFSKVNLIWLTGFRIFIGILPCLIMLIFSTKLRSTLTLFKPNKNWKYLIPASVLGTYLGMFAWISGFKFAHLGAVSAINKLSTLIVFILSVIFLSETISLKKGLLCLLGFSGALLIILSH